MGLHRGRTLQASRNGSSNSDLSKRIWWCTYAFDRFNAAQEGTPFLINEGDCDADILQPADLRDEDSVTSQATLLNITLSMVIEDAIRALYSPSASTDLAILNSARDRLLSELDKLYDRTVESLGSDITDQLQMEGFWCSILRTQ
jgi:hypothetical protein